MATNLTTNAEGYLLSVNKAGKYTVPTAKKFVDRNIVVDVPKATTNKDTGEVSPGFVNETLTKGDLLNAAVLSNTATAGVTYTDNSATAPVIINDYLYIEGGYIDSQKISLAQLVPNDSNIIYTAVEDQNKSDQMLQNVKAYDKDGKLIVGTIVTQSGVNKNQTIAAGDTATIPAGYYPESVKVTAQGTPATYSDYVATNTDGNGVEIITTGGYAAGGTYISGVAVPENTEFYVDNSGSSFTITADGAGELSIDSTGTQTIVSTNADIVYGDKHIINSDGSMVAANINSGEVYGSITGSCSIGGASAPTGYSNATLVSAANKVEGTPYLEIKPTHSISVGDLSATMSVAQSGWVNDGNLGVGTITLNGEALKGSTDHTSSFIEIFNGTFSVLDY